MFSKYEKGSEKLQELINNLYEELTNPQAKRELAELAESEQKEILEKAKWILLDQLIREES